MAGVRGGDLGTRGPGSWRVGRRASWGAGGGREGAAAAARRACGSRRGSQAPDRRQDVRKAGSSCWRGRSPSPAGGPRGAAAAAAAAAARGTGGAVREPAGRTAPSAGAPAAPAPPGRTDHRARRAPHPTAQGSRRRWAHAGRRHARHAGPGPRAEHTCGHAGRPPRPLSLPDAPPRQPLT
nr:spidroin-2-like [Camelus dromedarius]